MPGFIRKQLYGPSVVKNYGEQNKELVLSQEELSALRRMKGLVGKIKKPKIIDTTYQPQLLEKNDFRFSAKPIGARLGDKSYRRHAFKAEAPIPSPDQVEALRKKLNLATGHAVARSKVDLAKALSETRQIENIDEARGILKGLIKEKDYYGYPVDLESVYCRGSVPLTEQIKDYREILSEANDKDKLPSRYGTNLAKALSETRQIENINEAREILKGLIKKKDYYGYPVDLESVYRTGSVPLTEQIKDYREILSEANNKDKLSNTYRVKLAEVLAQTKEAKNVNEARGILKGLIKKKDYYTYYPTLDYIHRVGESTIAEKISDYEEISNYKGVSNTYAKELAKLKNSQLHAAVV